jgi:universal stress protein A
VYRHILAAVELDEVARDVLARAKELSRLFGAKLSVLHVVEYLPVDPAGDALLTTPVDLSRERATQAEKRLREWCQALGIGADALKVAVGAKVAPAAEAVEAV